MNHSNQLEGKTLTPDNGAFFVRDETSVSRGGSKDRNSHILSGSHHLPSHFVLENCVTANISRPQVAPIPKEERKKALIRAKYYSECLMQGINPDDASAAALDADTLFKKWWVLTKFSENEQHESRQDTKRRRMEAPDPLSNVLAVPTTTTGNDNPESMSYSVLHKEEDAAGRNETNTMRPHKRIQLPRQIHGIPELKATLIQLLRRHKGDTTSAEFHFLVNTLGEFYSEQGTDQRWTSGDLSTACNLDGTWLALSKSEFTGSTGRNENGEFLFPLGRVAFDMFRPTELLCSIQGAFNIINPWDPAQEMTRPVIYPASLMKASTLSRSAPLRKYELVFTLTIEPGQTRSGHVGVKTSDEYVVRRPFKCLLTNHGYCLPDPDVSNRLTVWFTGGSLEVEDEETDLKEWKQLFDKEMLPSRSTVQSARILAAKIFAGADLPERMSDDGSMEYSLNRPIGGHGKAFIDVIYADRTMRILRGHHGSYFVFTKVPNSA